MEIIEDSMETRVSKLASIVDDKTIITQLIRENSTRIKLITFKDARADIWQYFRLVCIDGHTLPYAVCIKCLKPVSYKAREGTGGLHRHPCSKHAIAMNALAPSSPSTSNSSSSSISAKRKINNGNSGSPQIKIPKKQSDKPVLAIPSTITHQQQQENSCDVKTNLKTDQTSGITNHRTKYHQANAFPTLSPINYTTHQSTSNYNNSIANNSSEDHLPNEILKLICAQFIPIEMLENGTLLKLAQSLISFGANHGNHASNILDHQMQVNTSLSNMSSKQVIDQYIGSVKNFLKRSGIKDVEEEEKPLLVEFIDSVCWIRLNRPEKKNRMNLSMLQGIVSALEDAEKDDTIKIVIITGNGDNYCNGHDLSIFHEMASQHGGDLVKGAQDAANLLQKFVGSFIDFPKPLIGAVNGPATGIAVTTLGLMDCVIASDSATFNTPFSGVSKTPEACVTHTFPRIIGTLRATQMILFNHTMDAKEAETCGLIAKIVPVAQFESDLKEWIHGENGLMKNCDAETMMTSKDMIRNEKTRKKLHEMNKRECDLLSQKWSSNEFTQALQVLAANNH